MRKVGVAFVLAAALGACARSPVPASGEYDPRRGISVTGEALVSVAPDIIVVTFGIDTRDLNLLLAKQQNDDIAKAALAAMANMGIADKDIMTDQLSISQRFITRVGQVFDGYTVRNMFAVTLNDPAKVADIISAALASGVNHLLNVDFQTSELKKHREQARDMAVKAAREKAEKMADALGATLGAPIQINEAQRYAAPSYYSSWSGAGWDNMRGNNVMMSQNVSQVSGGETTEGIALGKVAVRASVTVTFDLAR